MADAALRIQLGEVLYRTRGRDWDYAFLLQPEPIVVEGWYGIHRRIFGGIEPTATPTLLRGALGVGAGLPFFATAFTDESRRDYQARPIAHYLTWLGRAAEASPGASFGPGLVNALAPALDAVFELGSQLLRPGDDRPLDKLIRSRFQAALQAQTLDITAAVGLPLRWLGTLPA
jgi:hypothetical protein